MRSFITVAALLQSIVHLASAQISNETSSECAEEGGVHLIVARASTEPLGFGIIGAVKDQILSRIPGSNAEFVVYPATLADYTTSESDGVVAARALINAYVDNCPGQPIVVMGYSQGAQVTADSLVGQDVRNFPVNDTIKEPLPESTLEVVAGVIMMGDPSFVTTQPFHVGTATQNALFPRQNSANFDIAGLGSRTQSYCDAGDPYCAAPGNMIAVHVGYVGEYGAAAVSFIVDSVSAWYADDGETVPVKSATPSATATRSRATASSHVASSTVSHSVPSASASHSIVTASPSATPSATAPATSPPAYTGAASSLQVAGAGMGAIVAAAFALL